MIDSFSEIDLSDSADNIYKSLDLSNVSLVSIYDISIKDIDLDVHDSNTLFSNWNLNIAGVHQDVYMNLPFLHISSLMNNARFIDLTFTRFSFKDGIVSGGCLVHFPDDPTVNNLLVSRVADILFHRVVDYPDVVSFTSLEFGSSNHGTVKFLSKVKLDFPIKKYAHDAGNFFDAKHPLELEDIQAKIVQGGVDVVW